MSSESNQASSNPYRENVTSALPVKPSQQEDAIDDGFNSLREVLAPIASLKITVALFAFATVLTFLGTLAQDRESMVEVLDNYFYAWIAWFDFQVLFPTSWFPNSQNVRGAFPFPGGALIGSMMCINLLAAHVIRFKIQAKGGRMLAGLGVMGLGTAITLLVIMAGHSSHGRQGTPPIAWDYLWYTFLGGLTVLGMLGLGGAALLWVGKQRKIEAALLAGFSGITGLVAAWIALAGNDLYLGDSGMRILWQLFQGEIGAAVLLAGGILLFKKRAGVVVLHLGIGLLMFGQWFVSAFDVEEQMTIKEGETVNFARDIRVVELAVVDASPKEHDQVTVVPESIIKSAHNSGSQLSHEDLPFHIKVLQYFKHADLEDVTPENKDENIATHGRGLQVSAVEKRAGSGSDSGGEVDLAAAYVKFTDPKDDSDLGTYLLSQIISSQDLAEKVVVDGKTYDVYLRFKRNYKPYSVTLLDVRKDDYLGTNTPRNYSSRVVFERPERGEVEENIYMNNPLRDSGETFYQSGYHMMAGGVEVTTLQLVTNRGWMIPYVSCMIVGTGMFAHFIIALIRFLKRRSATATLQRMSMAMSFMSLGGILWPLLYLGALAFSGARNRDEALAEAERKKQKKGPNSDPAFNTPTSSSFADVALEPMSFGRMLSRCVPLLVFLLLCGWFMGKARPVQESKEELNIHAFGTIPVVFEGRVKPLDTVARNTLSILSKRQSFKDGLLEQQEKARLKEEDAKSDSPTEDDSEYESFPDVDRSPAILWLLDVMAANELAQEHRVFRIENQQVMDVLGLKRRKDHVFALAEFRDQVFSPKEQETRYQKDIQEALRLNKEDQAALTIYQRKLIELYNHMQAYFQIEFSFRRDLPPLPTREEFVDNRQLAMMKVERFYEAYRHRMETLSSMRSPLTIPVENKETEQLEEEEPYTWKPFAEAWANATIEKLQGTPNEAAVAFYEILEAYSDVRSSDAEPTRKQIQTFNGAVAKYHRILTVNQPPQLATAETLPNKIVEGSFGTFYAFESYFNKVAPFFNGWILYLVAFIVTACAWLGWSEPLNRTALAIISFTFIVHSLGLLARIYISERPPITNLYSSAVFIGWAGVMLGILVEYVFRNGFGNLLSSVTGFAALLIAYFLGRDGDTFTVLQAVLDTQFWLATHVVCITLGYSATFAAGTLGVYYVGRGFITPTLHEQAAKDAYRMTYGMVCFGMFFSFVGTVLGGLWADDSWGRFWGWDPKENGALMIVLWNALVLHARWDGMVREKGFAVLAIGGNIITAWSWFGVNELGVGLHSYGFTEGVLQILSLFVGSQLLLIVLGSLPKSMWWSHIRRNRDMA